MHYAITTLVTLVLCLRASAQVPAVAPEDFSHVVGDWFRIEASAAPTQLAVEDPLVLTVRISADATGPAVLEPAGPSWLLQPWALALLLLLPPAGCIAWYAYWRRHHPDAVRELKQRRHCAAELTLRELQSGEPAAQRLAAVL